MNREITIPICGGLLAGFGVWFIMISYQAESEAIALLGRTLIVAGSVLIMAFLTKKLKEKNEVII